MTSSPRIIGRKPRGQMGRGRPAKGVLVVSQLPELLEIWNRAINAPIGIRIMSERPNTLLQKLYMARRECGHNAYNGFKLVEKALTRFGL
jgi:hypothetical protein